MANGESEQTDAPALGNIQNPKTEEPDTRLNPDTKNIDNIRDSIPQFKGLNSYYLKKKLLEDDETFEKTANQIFTQGVGFKNIRDGDPEKIRSAYEGFKKNFRQDLVNSSYSGEDIDETLVNRSMSLADDPTKVNAGDYASIVKDNPKKYKAKGLIDEDGEFLYEGEDTAFAQHVLSNSGLHKELQQDRYKAFENELGKYHNQVDDLDDPAVRTKAWVVYDKKGPEGLTQFINKVQEETIDESVDENSYFRKAKVGDTSLSESYRRFVTGNVEGVKYGDKIAEASYKNDIDPALFASLIRQESNFDPNAESDKGAVGLAQLMPDTARVDLGIDPEDRTDPDKSINGGAVYLRRLLDRYDNDEEKALAAYNAGMGNVDKAIKKSKEEGQSWKDYLPKPEETLPYIEKVKNYKSEYQDKVDRGLVFRPRKPRQDITEDVPKDLNGYNVDKYNRDGSLKDFDEVIGGYVKQKLPKAIEKGFKKERLSKEGPYSDEYREITKSIYKDAVEEGKFSTQDLMNTLYANAEYHRKGDQGDEFYQIDLKNMTWEQRMAFDALQFNPEVPSMIKDQGDGVHRIYPDIKTKALRTWEEARSNFYMTETEVRRDQDGNIVFDEKPAKDMMSQSLNALTNLVFGGAKFANDYAMKPIFSGLNKLTGGEYDWIREMKDATEAQTSISLSELSSAEEDGWVPNATEEVAPMFWYMAGMFGAGGAITKGVGKGLQLISRGKAGADMTRMGALLNGSSKWNQIGKGIQQSKNPAMKLYAGGAGLEALTPKKDSFYNVIPRLFGEKQDNELRKFYNTADWWTRKAMDVGGSLMLDFGIDTFIGASKFMKDSFAKKFFDRDEFRSYDPIREVDKNGNMTIEYEMTDTPQFTHEIRRFYNEISNGLANKPMGEVGETMAKDLADEANVNTLHDFVKKYTDTTSGVAGNIKSEIREHVLSLQKKFGNGVKLGDQDLDNLVNAQYERFVDGSADNLYKMLKESDDPNLPLRFAQVLDEQLPTIKEAKIGNRKIKPSEAAHWREEKNMNLVVKGDKVYEVDPKFWTNDLATKIRQKHLQASPEKVAMRKAREAGIDPKNLGDRADEFADIKQTARQTVGTPTVVDGKLGYVMDYGDDSFDVVTSDGVQTVKSLQSDMGQERLARMTADGVAKDFSQKRMAMIMGSSLEDTPRFGPQRMLPAPERSPTPTMESVRNMRQQVENFGREMLQNLSRDPQRMLPSAGKVERRNLEEVMRIDDRIQNLENNYRSLDQEIPDDGAKRGAMKANITKELKTLREQREQAMNRLSRFYAENPDVQKSRVQQVIQESNNKKFELTDPLNKYLIPESTASKMEGMEDTINKHNNTVRRAWNNPDKRIKRNAGDYYFRQGDGLFNVRKMDNDKWVVRESTGRYEVTDQFDTMSKAMEATERVVKSWEEPKIKNMRKKLDDFAQKMQDLAKSETRIPFC